MRYVILYLVAIVVANIAFADVLDPAAGHSIGLQLMADFVICFAFIGFDMAVRDKLHDRWGNDRLLMKMSTLILAGSAISYGANWILNAASPEIVFRVASASFLAFALAGFTDFGVYHGLRRRSPMIRVNGSNLPSAVVDSLVFPLVAFGLPMMWNFFAVELAAKIIGGLFWSTLLIGSGFLGHDSSQPAPA